MLSTRPVRLLCAFLLVAMLAAVVGGCAPGTSKPEYPTKTVKWIVMWKSGGGADTATRIYTKYLEKELGQSIIVENITGGGGSIGYAAAKEARADGYTLVTIQGDLPKFRPMDLAPIDIDDFTIVGSFAYQAPIFVVRADSPWETLEQFMEDAKRRPGQLTIGISDIGGTYHQPMVLWMEMAGIDCQAIVHEGSPQQTAALLGKHVDALITWVLPNMPYVEEKTFRFLGYMANERLPDYPDVPTFKEMGYDLAWEHSYGVGGPGGLPDDVVKVLDEANRKIWENPDFRAELENLGLLVSRLDGKEFADELKVIQGYMVEVLRLLE